MKLYNSFCYESINDAANSIASYYFIGDGQLLQSVSIASADTVQVTTNNSGTSYSYLLTLPDCERTGFDNSFFGITPSDAVELSWLCATAMIVAWCIKVMKRGI